MVLTGVLILSTSTITPPKISHKNVRFPIDNLTNMLIMGGVMSKYNPNPTKNASCGANM